MMCVCGARTHARTLAYTNTYVTARARTRCSNSSADLAPESRGKTDEATDVPDGTEILLPTLANSWMRASTSCFKFGGNGSGRDTAAAIIIMASPPLAGRTSSIAPTTGPRPLDRKPLKFRGPPRKNLSK